MKKRGLTSSTWKNLVDDSCPEADQQVRWWGAGGWGPHNVHQSTVESRYNGFASNGNLLITEEILWSLEKFFFNFYIGNNRNPPITDKNGWSLEIR